jgi:hypothetical protein
LGYQKTITLFGEKYPTTILHNFFFYFWHIIIHARAGEWETIKKGIKKGFPEDIPSNSTEMSTYNSNILFYTPFYNFII